MKYFLLHIFLFIFCSGIFSQDFFFSQFNDNPQLINPALTGAAQPLRASTLFRQQWKSFMTPYQTSGLSFELRFNPSEWQQVDKFRSMTFKEKSFRHIAGGLSVYNAKDGASGFGITTSNLSIATFVPLNSKHFLSLGLQGSIVQRTIDNSNCLFPNQFNGSNYDQSLSSGEKFNSLSLVYPDFAAGILWGFVNEEQRVGSGHATKAHLGFSCYHVTQPKQYFLKKSSMLAPHFVFHGDVLFVSEENNFGLQPSFKADLQGSSFTTVAGCVLKTFFKHNSKYTGIVKRSAINYGIHYRYMDAVIINFLFDIGEQYGIGICYDVTISNLSSTNGGQGGYELLLRYTPPKGFLYQEKAVIEK